MSSTNPPTTAIQERKTTLEAALESDQHMLSIVQEKLAALAAKDAVRARLVGRLEEDLEKEVDDVKTMLRHLRGERRRLRSDNSYSAEMRDHDDLEIFVLTSRCQKIGLVLKLKRQQSICIKGMLEKTYQLYEMGLEPNVE